MSYNAGGTDHGDIFDKCDPQKNATAATQTQQKQNFSNPPNKEKIKEELNTQMCELTHTQMYKCRSFTLPLVSLMLHYVYVSSFMASSFFFKGSQLPLSCFDSLLPSSAGANVSLEMKMLLCHSLCMDVFLWVFHVLGVYSALFSLVWEDLGCLLPSNLPLRKLTACEHKCACVEEGRAGLKVCSSVMKSVFSRSPAAAACEGVQGWLDVHGCFCVRRSTSM